MGVECVAGPSSTTSAAAIAASTRACFSTGSPRKAPRGASSVASARRRLSRPPGVTGAVYIVAIVANYSTDEKIPCE